MPLPVCFDSQSDHNVMTAKTIRILTRFILLVFVAVNAVTIADFLVLFAVDDAVAVAILVIFVVAVVTIVAVVVVLMDVVGSGRAACT